MEILRQPSLLAVCANVFAVKCPVLIVIDMVNAFLANWPEGAKTRLLASTNDLVRLMRQRGYPIIWVRQEFEPDLRDAFPEMISKGIRITIRGTDGCQIVSSLDVIPSDAVVVKLTPIPPSSSLLAFPFN